MEQKIGTVDDINSDVSGNSAELMDNDDMSIDF
jgi:hypothetical protein